MNEDDPKHASNFNGKVFDATSTRMFDNRKTYANPLYYATDIDALSRVQERIEHLQEDGELPSSYDVHNPVQLMPERVFDTTNRSSVLGAQKYAFDPEGFRTGKPLRRTIFYLDPFITCQWCNMVTFVDVMAIRRSIAMPDELSQSLELNMETLPPCRKCGRADYLEVGSHDFSDIIEAREREAKERARIQLAAALLIQKNFREYLRRAYARAAAEARRALLKLQTKAATRINSCARYRLAQRRFLAEYHLRVIKTSHPVLLAHARKKPKKPDRRFNFKTKTFWFERQVELDFVFRDYVGLAERLGWQPTRKQMEINFIELSKRITARKDDLLSLVQRAWRGFMARRIVMYYRTEVIRLKQFLLSKAFKIQRLYRGHRVRLRMPAMRAQIEREKQEDEYFQFREQKRAKRERDDMIATTKAAYIKERAEERTARYTGRIDVATDHDDRKMKAFAASCYSDDRLQNQIDSLLEKDLYDLQEYKAKVKADHDRKEFILNRIKETGPSGYGKRSEMPDPSLQRVMHGIKVGPELMPPRSSSMKKLLYHEVTEIMEGVIERATHNFIIPNLHNRLREFNSERAVSKRQGGPVHPSKILESKLGGLLDNEGDARGAKLSSGSLRRQSSSLSAKRRQEVDDDLGGTGSAFDYDDLKMVDTDGESDEEGDYEGLATRKSSTSGKFGGSGRHNSALGGSSGSLTRQDSKNLKHKFLGRGMDRKNFKQKKQHRFFKDYKYPSGINENPMDFLNEDMELILAYTDKKAKEKQAASVEEELKGQTLRSKTRKKTGM